MSTITINIEFPVLIEEKEGYFSASCGSLDIYAEGSTHNEAKNHILEALEVFVSTCVEMGTLEQVLRDSGYRTVHEVRAAPDLNEELVNVPLSLLAAKDFGLSQAYAH